MDASNDQKLPSFRAFVATIVSQNNNPTSPTSPPAMQSLETTTSATSSTTSRSQENDRTDNNETHTITSEMMREMNEATVQNNVGEGQALLSIRTVTPSATLSAGTTPPFEGMLSMNGLLFNGMDGIGGFQQVGGGAGEGLLSVVGEITGGIATGQQQQQEHHQHHHHHQAMHGLYNTYGMLGNLNNGSFQFQGDHGDGGEGELLQQQEHDLQQQQALQHQQQNLQQHQLLPHRTYACTHPGCGKQFAYLSILKVHTRVHTGDRPHKCHLCENSYTTSSRLKIHIRSHTNESPYMCEFAGCGKKFKSNSNLAQHSRVHMTKREREEYEARNKRTVACKVCGNLYKTVKSMDQHYWREHVGKGGDAGAGGSSSSSSGVQKARRMGHNSARQDEEEEDEYESETEN